MNRNTILNVIIFGGFAAVLVGVTVALSLGVINGPEATAYSTIILVAITGSYVYTTRQLVNETAKSRRQELAPKLEIECLRSGVKLVNIGSGPALNLHVNCWLDCEHRLSLHRSHLRAGDSVRLDDRKINQITMEESDIADGYKVLHLLGNYENSFKDRKCIGKAPPVTQLTSEAQTASDDHAAITVHHLKGIENALTRIERKIPGEE